MSDTNVVTLDHPPSRGGHTVPVPRKPLRPRSVKVSDELWEAATKAADANDEHLSEAIRRFLEKYAKDYRKKGKQ